jgi:hypothetical protein
MRIILRHSATSEQDFAQRRRYATRRFQLVHMGVEVRPRTQGVRKVVRTILRFERKQLVSDHRDPFVQPDCNCPGSIGSPVGASHAMVKIVARPSS